MWIEKFAVALALAMPLHGIAEESKKIQDNSFLLEEAYNQEAGVVQHIQSFMYMKKSKDWVYAFTQEWPFPDETHQLSYTVPMVRLTDPSNASGIGDIALNSWPTAGSLEAKTDVRPFGGHAMSCRNAALPPCNGASQGRAIFREQLRVCGIHVVIGIEAGEYSVVMPAATV